uniref:hypothetical protein n=1 Tax=Paraburkholderia phenoliruptrix TaxID=252970 RepID=UPI001ABA21FA
KRNGPPARSIVTRRDWLARARALAAAEDAWLGTDGNRYRKLPGKRGEIAAVVEDEGRDASGDEKSGGACGVTGRQHRAQASTGAFEACRIA